MAHDVFLSYSSKDKPAADAACAVLESAGLRCWIAPRDIRPGDDWGGAIIQAIAAAKVFVLIFSSNANQSPQIRREVERAVNRGLPVIPMRIENVDPTGALEYFINTPHWLDAFTPPLSKHLQYLADVAGHIVRGSDGEAREPGLAPPVPLAVRPPRGPVYAAVAVVLALVLAVGLYRLWPRPPIQREAVAASAQYGAEAEVAFWNSIAASNNAAQLQAYLDRYPKGLYVEVARAKLAALNKPQAPALAALPARAPRAQAAPLPASAPPARAASSPPPAHLPDGPYVGWWRAAQGSGSADFGGAPFANYHTVLSSVSVSVQVGSDGKLVDGVADGVATESILGGGGAGIPVNKHVFRLLRGEVVDDDITADFLGDASNQPATRATLRGHFRDSEIVATLTVNRVNNGVVPQVLWSIAIPVVLRR